MTFISEQIILRYMSKAGLSDLLLKWYEKSGRELPWRVKGGAHPDPYVILVSEFMLQQTTVKTVIPYFYRFMERFPTIKDLAAATQEEVYLYWQGLGYYSRARALHITARMIMTDFGGCFPQTRHDVLKLKGIGPYTVASFLALAFNQPETVIDGNVIRIICRMYHLTEAASEIKDIIEEKARALTPRENCADYASAIMDLGAVICTPKNPQCLICPWRDACRSQGLPELEQIPQRPKTAKKIKNGSVYLIYNRIGDIFIRKRTEKGLLSGLYEFPWCDDGKIAAFADAEDTGNQVTHVFTHFKLTLKIYRSETDSPAADGFFCPVSELENYPFSTLMQKVLSKKPH